MHEDGRVWEMFGWTERFSEDIGRLFGSRNMTKVDLIRCVHFLNVVKTSVDVLRTGMLDIIFNMIESRSGVCVD